MKRRKVKPIDHYQWFVRSEFDTLSIIVQNKILFASKEAKNDNITPISSEQLLVSTVTTEDIEMNDDSFGEGDLFEDDDDTELRTICYPLQPHLRPDLAEDIKNYFLGTPENALGSSSDYIIAYSIQVLKIITLFKSGSFE